MGNEHQRILIDFERLFAMENISRARTSCATLTPLSISDTDCLRNIGREAMQEQERWMSVEEIAVHLGINRDTVYKWIDRKRMPAHKVGRLWKFQVSEINEWVRAGKAGTRTETALTTIPQPAQTGDGALSFSASE